ncbi:hypothetical protein DPEC_G00364360 [Dallia pectoralis]|nr:hypothetical protein DPEC_G00364200 [Dallia pectoralis]KAJ7984152.1 hypothetical protein DPEC_G00364360 [Dallia pectoralis]
MSTCGPGHLTAGSARGIPELFFVATAIKACYGRLPSWESSERPGWSPDDEPIRVKRSRFQDARQDCGVPEQRQDTIDAEYRRLYRDLRTKALLDIKALIREHVEKLSTTPASYDFMNIYGMCSFDPPNVARLSRQNGEPLSCKFTEISCPEDNANSNSHRLISVTGILNPLISARVEHGELELTHCGESDYHRATEELARLESRSKMRVPRVCKGNLGSTIGSMENRFIFTVREDLHKLGCAYRQMVVIVELLHLTMLHFIHS